MPGISAETALSDGADTLPTDDTPGAPGGEITDTEVTDLPDPRIRAIADRVARQVELAVAKVAANAGQPQQFPFPSAETASDENSIEQILAARFSTLAPGTQQAAAARAMDLINAPSDVRARRFGDLAKVDLRTSVAIEQQVAALLFPAELKFPAGELRPADNDKVTYSPPRNFTTFSLTAGTEFPKSYFVTLVLAEIDMGGIPEFLDKLLSYVKDKVTAALTAAIGTAIGVSGAAIDAIIGAAVSYVVGLVFDLFKSVWEDDIFKPVTVATNISSLSARWPGGQTDSPNKTTTYSGFGGKYQLVYDWRMLP